MSRPRKTANGSEFSVQEQGSGPLSSLLGILFLAMVLLAGCSNNDGRTPSSNADDVVLSKVRIEDARGDPWHSDNIPGASIDSIDFLSVQLTGLTGGLEIVAEFVRTPSVASMDFGCSFVLPAEESQQNLVDSIRLDKGQTTTIKHYELKEDALLLEIDYTAISRATWATSFLFSCGADIYKSEENAGDTTEAQRLSWKIPPMAGVDPRIDHIGPAYEPTLAGDDPCCDVFVRNSTTGEDSTGAHPRADIRSIHIWESAAEIRLRIQTAAAPNRTALLSVEFPEAAATTGPVHDRVIEFAYGTDRARDVKTGDQVPSSRPSSVVVEVGIPWKYLEDRAEPNGSVAFDVILRDESSELSFVDAVILKRYVIGQAS